VQYPQVFRSTLEFLEASLVPQVEARYPRPLMDTRRARAMSRASQPPRAHHDLNPYLDPNLDLAPTLLSSQRDHNTMSASVVVLMTRNGGSVGASRAGMSVRG